jgi:acyl-CoA thioester hydrolase
MDSRGMARNYNRRILSEPVETEDRKLAHVERIPIRWGDMDAMGHVNNIVYFRYMEQARISWFESLLPSREAAWKSHGIVIANASCNFRRALAYPGTVEVKVFTGKPGGSSVPTYYELRLDDDPDPYADGAATVVFVDVESQKPIRIPDKLRESMQ